MTKTPDHEFEELETDSSVPPRPEEDIADAGQPDRREPAEHRNYDGPPAQGYGSQDSQ